MSGPNGQCRAYLSDVAICRTPSRVMLSTMPRRTSRSAPVPKVTAGGSLVSPLLSGFRGLTGHHAISHHFARCEAEAIRSSRISFEGSTPSASISQVIADGGRSVAPCVRPTVLCFYDVSNAASAYRACVLIYSVSTCHRPGAYTSSQTSSGPSSSENVFTRTKTGTGVPGSTSTPRASSS